VRSERCLEDRQRAAKQPTGLVVPAGGAEQHGQRGTLGGGVGTLGAGRRLADADGLAGRRLAVRRPARGVRRRAVAACSPRGRGGLRERAAARSQRQASMSIVSL
jgi:hypothetical protein